MLFFFKPVFLAILFIPFLLSNSAAASEKTLESRPKSTIETVPTLTVPTSIELPNTIPVSPHWQQSQDNIEEKEFIELIELDDVDEIDSDTIFSPAPEYLIPPRIAPDERINPFTTTLPLDRTPISHLTDWQFTTGTIFGNDVNTTFQFNGIIKLDSEIVESLTVDNIFTVEQTGSYFRFGTIQGYEREVKTTFTEPQTVTGLELQMSLTGACLFSDAEPTDQCTFTPGLVVDRDSIDPDFLVPTRIFQTSNVGDVVTPESLAVMRLPGFQRGANGQKIGLDLFFPNTGAFPGNTQSERTNVSRSEELTNAYTGTLSRVHQIVKANDNRAVLGRTIYGFTILSEEDNFISNFGLQMAANILPIIDPKIEPGEGTYNPNINRNLFIAPNNVRLPGGSSTVYHAGIGSARSLTPPIISLSEVPNAEFNSIWFGFSPVTQRSIERDAPRFNITGPVRDIVRAGGEGGANSNVVFVSAVNNDIFSTNDLTDFYTQIYLAFTNQDVDTVSTSTFREKTRFYPHLSATGNITGTNDVLRYYSGVIFSPETKAYLGGDYTQNITPTWNYTMGAIGYINPDRDYYSQLWGNTSKRFRFNPQTNLTLSSGFEYAIDRDLRISDVVSTSPASRLTVGANLNWKNLSIGVLNYFGGVFPDSFEDTLITSVGVQVSDNLRVSGFVSPINKNTSRARYGAGLSWQLDNAYNSPSFSLNWSRNEYDFGNDLFGNDLLVRDNVFTVLFRMGSPANPFDPTTAERLRGQRDTEDFREDSREDPREGSRDDLRDFPSPEAP